MGLLVSPNTSTRVRELCATYKWLSDFIAFSRCERQRHKTARGERIGGNID